MRGRPYLGAGTAKIEMGRWEREAFTGHTNLPLFSEIPHHPISSSKDPHEDVSASAK